MNTQKTITPLDLEAYCDGELPPEDTQRVSASLAHDAGLRRQLDEISRARDRLRAAGTSGEGDDDSAINILAGKLQRQIDLRRRRWLIHAGVVAVLVLGAVGAAGWFGHARFAPAGPTQMGDVTIPAFVRDAAGAHSIFAFDAVHPVEFTSSDEQVMRAWFAAHLGKAASVPHLEEVGFDLVGGRLLGDAEGAMAQILYENDKGDRVSLVYGKRMTEGGRELRLVKVGKSFASYWQDNGFAWAVVEDTPGADVSAVAHHVANLVNETRE